MSLRVTCPGCAKRFVAADSDAGKMGRCPACGATFSLPAGAETVTDFEVARPFDDADFDVPRTSRPSVTLKGSCVRGRVDAGDFGEADEIERAVIPLQLDQLRRDRGWVAGLAIGVAAFDVPRQNAEVSGVGRSGEQYAKCEQAMGHAHQYACRYGWVYFPSA